jgi:Ca-activated chloride channel family protein
MILDNPEALLLLLLIPLIWHRRKQRRRPAAIRFSDTGGLAALERPRRLMLLPTIRVLMAVSCVIALARPQWGLELTKVYVKGIAIAMVVDVSSSMSAVDLVLDNKESDRLDVVKATIRSFLIGDRSGLAGREGDLVSLVSFARYADSMSPLTLDHDAVVALLDQLEIAALPADDGTSIGEAIVLGIERLMKASETSRVMVLLTDGYNNSGDTEPLEAARMAKALGVKIYTIGTGTEGTAIVPVRYRDGHVELRPAQVYIDDRTLTDVAELTGGRYFRATDAEALQSIYAEISQLEKSEHVAEQYQKYVDLFPIPLALALALLAAEVILANTRLQAVP